MEQHQRAARRLARPVDRARRSGAHDRSERRGREREYGHGAHVDGAGLRHGTVLSRHHHEPLPVSDLRRATGQQHPVWSVAGARWHYHRHVEGCRRWRVGLHCRAAEQSGHRVCRQLRWLSHAQGHAHGDDARCESVAAQSHGARCEGRQVPHAVDVPHRGEPARSEDAVRGVERAVQDHQRRRQLYRHFPRSVAQ